MRSYVKAEIYLLIAVYLCSPTRGLAQIGQSTVVGSVPKPTSSARAMFRIECAPESGLCNPQLMNSLLFSPALMDKVIEACGGVASTEKVSGGVQLANTSVSDLPPGVCLATIHVASFDEKLPAKKLLNAFPNALVDELQRVDPTIDRARIQFEKLARHKDQTRAHLELLNKKYQEGVERLGASAFISPEEAASISADRRQASVALRGLIARRNAIEIRIAELGKTIQTATAKDPVIKELEMAVAAREQQRERLAKLAVSGTATTNDISEAEVGVALARADLAKYRRSTVSAEGDRIAELQRRLDDTTVEIAEQEAKLEALASPQYDVRMSSELAAMRSQIESLQRQYDELQEMDAKQKLDLELHRQPRVTLIAGPAAPKLE